MLRWGAAAALALSACGRFDFDPLDPQALGTVTVEPTYAAAPGWNDYVRREIQQQPAFLQPGTPCDGTETGSFSACIHAGVQRRAVLDRLTSCAGVTATDSLGALQWRCDDSSGTAIVYSTGLRGGAGLGDLVDATGWKPEQLRVSVAGVTTQSTAAAWWTDPVMPLPGDTSSSVAPLDQPGTIYVLAQSRTSTGINVTADHVALVTLPGATLSYAVGMQNCDEGSGEPTNVNQRCLVAAGGQTFVWIEGSFDAQDVASYALLVGNSRFSQLRRVRATSATLTAVVLLGGSSNALIDVTGANSKIYGIAIDTTSGNIARDIRVFGNGRGNITGEAGLIVADGAMGNVFSRLVTANNFDYDLLEYNATARNTYSHVTVASSANGIDIQGAGAAAVVQALMVNTNVGLRFDSDSNLAAQIAIAHGQYGLCLAGASSRIQYNLLIGNQTVSDCRTGSICQSSLLCDAITGSPAVSTGLDATAALRYKVMTDDAANPSDVAGQGARTAITDWTDFESPLRGWGPDGDVFPSATDQGDCASACRIWDWRHVIGDTSLVVRDATGAQDTETVTRGAPCPAAAAGDFAVTDVLGNTFLVNALEVLGDGAGDDDGLCETGEACVYSGYLGADQGWQDTYGTGTCVFTDGLVSGVEMHGP